MLVRKGVAHLVAAATGNPTQPHIRQQQEQEEGSREETHKKGNVFLVPHLIALVFEKGRLHGGLPQEDEDVVMAQIQILIGRMTIELEGDFRGVG